MKKIILGIMLLSVMSATAGCAADYGQVKAHKLTAKERYELGIRADKLEGLKPVIIKKKEKVSAGRTVKKVEVKPDVKQY